MHYATRIIAVVAAAAALAAAATAPGQKLTPITGWKLLLPAATDAFDSSMLCVLARNPVLNGVTDAAVQ